MKDFRPSHDSLQEHFAVMPSMDTHWEEKNGDRRHYYGEALHAWIPGEALADGYITKSVDYI